MSQETTLLISLATHLSVDKLLEAAIKDVGLTTRLSNLQLLFRAHRDAHSEPMCSAKAFLDYVYSGGKDEQLGPEIVAQIASTICDALKDATFAPGVLAERDWIDSLQSAVAKDDVATLMALDQAGLIDRTSVGVEGVMHDVWEAAIAGSAARCNRYLLTTTSLADLAGFPQSFYTWPENMAMATDIVAHVPPEELAEVLEILDEAARYAKGSEHLKSNAECAVAALLERCSHDPEFVENPIFNSLLSAMILHTATGAHVRLQDPAIVVAMLGVMERCHMMGGPEAFRYAEKLLEDDENGELIAPAYLQSLIDRGLRVQSKREWNKDEEVRHLLSEASLCHFEVLDAQVPDKEAFMREFGPVFVANHANGSSNGEIQGADNVAMMALAQMGYPFGPIAVPGKDGKQQMKSVYERIDYGASLADAFIVGHLCGHLDDQSLLHGVRPMHVAVGRRHVPSIAALAERGHSIDEPCAYVSYIRSETGCRGCEGMTPLIMALKKNDEPLVRALIELGADTAVKAPTGATVMQLAKSEELKALIRSARTAKAVGNGLEIAAPSGQRAPAKKPRFDAL